MKEIDFLPEWYKSGRRRKVTYRTQYVVLSGIFLVMMVWNFFAARSVSKAEAKLVQMTQGCADVESTSLKFAQLKGEVGILQKRTASIEEIDSKINVASVLAELSFLIDRGVVLAKVELIAEKFADMREPKRSQRAGAVVRAARAGFNKRQDLPLGDVRFKVVISGVAADASDVASLICKLEDSPYFFQVVPSFSRSKEIKAQPSRVKGPSDTREPGRSTGRLSAEPDANINASEFEISCYLANYNEQ